MPFAFEQPNRLIYEYDKSGNLTKIYYKNDPQNWNSIMRYDSKNRVIERTDTHDNNGVKERFKYQYDSKNRVIKVELEEHQKHIIEATYKDILKNPANEIFFTNQIKVMNRIDTVPIIGDLFYIAGNVFPMTTRQFEQYLTGEEKQIKHKKDFREDIYDFEFEYDEYGAWTKCTMRLTTDGYKMGFVEVHRYVEYYD